MRLGRAYPASRIVFPPPKFQLPSYDNSAMSSNQASLANNTPFTFGITVTGTRAILAVGGNVNSTTSDLTVPATVTIGGVALTEVGGVFANATTSSSFIRVFTADGIPTGGQTASVQFNQSGTTFSGIASAYTYTNVASMGTLQTNVGNGATGSVDVPASNGDVVWGCIIRAAAPTTFSSFTLTQRQTHTGGGLPHFIAGDITATTNPQTVSVGLGSGAWAAVGLQLIGS